MTESTNTTLTQNETYIDELIQKANQLLNKVDEDVREFKQLQKEIRALTHS